MNTKAFTLIELLVVIVIIGILSALIFISLGSARGAAFDAKIKADVNQIAKAVMIYKTNNPTEVLPSESCEIGNNCSNDTIFGSSLIFRNPQGGYYEYISSNGVDFIIRSRLSTEESYCFNSETGRYLVGDCGGSLIIGGGSPVLRDLYLHNGEGFIGSVAIDISSHNGVGFIEPVTQLTEVPVGWTGIYTVQQLIDIKDDYGDTAPYYNNDYILMSNLDLTGLDWGPIGVGGPPFDRIFNGNGYVIRNLTINNGAMDGAALFGYVGPGGKISNLGLENVNISGGRYSAGMVGRADSDGLDAVIINSYVTGNVSGVNYVGGLIGGNFVNSSTDFQTISKAYTKVNVQGTQNRVGGLIGDNWGNIEYSYSTGTVAGLDYVGGLVGMSGSNYNNRIINSYASGDVNGHEAVGGLVGTNYRSGSRVLNSYATGDIEATFAQIGGLIGVNEGLIEECYAEGDIQVSGESYRAVGGLVGNNYGNILTSYAAGSVNSNTPCTGGFIGINDGLIEKSYAVGNVQSSSDYVGGLVGQNQDAILNTYAKGSVSTSSGYVGGLVGRNLATIENSYSNGLVSGGSNIGGLIGANWGSLVNGYYNSDNANQSDNDGRGEPLTSAELGITSKMVNWDFDNIWIIP